jgi:hypothetical protein
MLTANVKLKKNRGVSGEESDVRHDWAHPQTRSLTQNHGPSARARRIAP